MTDILVMSMLCGTIWLIASELNRTYSNAVKVGRRADRIAKAERLIFMLRRLGIESTYKIHFVDIQVYVVDVERRCGIDE